MDAAHPKPLQATSMERLLKHSSSLGPWCSPRFCFLVEVPQNLAIEVSSQLRVCVSGNELNPSKHVSEAKLQKGAPPGSAQDLALPRGRGASILLKDCWYLDINQWLVGTVSDGWSSPCSVCLHGEDGCRAGGLPLSLSWVFYSQ